MKAKFISENTAGIIMESDIPWPPHMSASFVEKDKRYVITSFDSIKHEVYVVEVPMEYGKLPVAIPTGDPETVTKTEAKASDKAK